MKALSTMVTIAENNEECVILKVKKNQFANLASLGCFDGTETMFRLTKGDQHTCIVWHGADNQNYSWDWGTHGYTLVSDNMSKEGSLIQNCIQNELGIYIGSDLAKIKQTLYKRKPTPKAKKYVAMWWNNQDSIVVHRDGEFWKSFADMERFKNFVKSCNGTIKQTSELYHSPFTGCCMMDFEVTM